MSQVKSPWRYQFTTILGVLVVVLPFLGFPSAWHQVLFVIIGCLLIGTGLTGQRQLKKDSFLANQPKDQTLPLED